MTSFKFLTPFAFIFYLLVTVDVENNLVDFVPGEKIEAEDFSFGENVEILKDCDDSTIIYVGYIVLNMVLEYSQVDFGYGVDGISLRVVNDIPGKMYNISLHLGSSTNPPFITIPVNYIGSYYCDFATLNVKFSSPVVRVQDLFFTFPSETYSFVNLDWFVLHQMGANFIATQLIQAEDYSNQQNTWNYSCTCTSVHYIGKLSSDSFLEFDLVDFGSGVEMVTVRVSSFYDGEHLDISLHLDNSTNDPFVTIPVGQTGSGECKFLTFATFLDTKPSGVHDLFLTFPSAQGGYLNLDWLVFNQTVNSN